MRCAFTEKVSLLLDEELPREECEQLTQHLTSCMTCRQAQEDFLRLRNQIQGYGMLFDPIVSRRALKKILPYDQVPLWKKKIVLPVPVFSLLILCLIILGTWSLSARFVKPVQFEINLPIEERKLEPGGSEAAADLSRFDRGERAVIYKVRRVRDRSTPQ